MTLLQKFGLPPDEIQPRSFAIIEGLLPDTWPAAEREIVRRIVHTVGDATIAPLVRIHPAAVGAGVAALRTQANIFVDVGMVGAGISRGLVGPFGCAVHCAIDDPEVAAAARREGITRAATAMRSWGRRLEGSVVVIGNAPTALLALLDLVDAGAVSPALVVGTPVGFVGAAEAKAELVRRAVPYITVEGTRGGSAIAAAAVNALLVLAQRGA